MQGASEVIPVSYLAGFRGCRDCFTGTECTVVIERVEGVYEELLRCGQFYLSRGIRCGNG